jgi:hypothetical protein
MRGSQCNHNHDKMSIVGGMFPTRKFPWRGALAYAS